MDFIQRRKILIYRLVVLISAVLVYFGVIFPAINIDSISYDSSYQYALTNKSFGEMMRLIPYDYSPAFYSIFLKVFTLICGSSLKVMRMSSFVIYMGGIILCLFPVKRAFGFKVSLISSVLFVFNSSYFVVFGEIRPHALGLVLVTAASVYAYLVYKEEQVKDYVIFTAFSIMAMYTHNVAMFAMFCYYVVLLVFAGIAKNIKQIKRVFISGIICAICYIPNLIMLTHQFGNVQNNYWRSGEVGVYDTVFDSLFLNIYAWRQNQTGRQVLSAASAIVPYIVLAAVCIILVSGSLRSRVVKFVSKKLKNITIKDAIFLILLYWLPLLFFFSITRFFVAIYASRYMYMFSLVGLLGIIVIVSELDVKHVVTILLMCSICFNFVVGNSFYKNKMSSVNIVEMAQKIKEENPNEDDIYFVHSTEWSMGIMMYYFPNAHHYITDDVYCVLNSLDVFPSEIINIGDPDNISNYTDTFYTLDIYIPAFKWNPAEYYSDSQDYEVKRYDENYQGVESANKSQLVQVKTVAGHS